MCMVKGEDRATRVFEHGRTGGEGKDALIRVGSRHRYDIPAFTFFMGRSCRPVNCRPGSLALHAHYLTLPIPYLMD